MYWRKLKSLNQLLNPDCSRKDAYKKHRWSGIFHCCLLDERNVLNFYKPYELSDKSGGSKAFVKQDKHAFNQTGIR